MLSSSNRNQEEFSEDDFYKKFQQPKHLYSSEEKYTSDYYKDLTQEKNMIERAFQSNNYTYIRQLPKDFKHKEILNERLKRAKQQLDEEEVIRSIPYEEKLKKHDEAIKNKKTEQIGNMGYFEAFTYSGQTYDVVRKMAADQYKQSKMKRKQISDLDWRPSDIDFKAKYQDPFQFRDKANPKIRQSPNYLFPFNIPSDTYSSFHQSIARKKMNQQAQMLAGPFLPSMKQKSLNRVHRSQLNQILKDIESFIQKFLKRYPYILAVTVNDHIELLFEQTYKQDVKLKTVLSMICQNESLSKYFLKRDVNRWELVDGPYICFGIIPPWVNYSLKDQVMEGTSSQIAKIMSELEKQTAIQK